MRRVLMVSPHFPPDSSAASHRVRLLAPHLANAGWTPTVVTLEPSAYEGRLDPELGALVPPSLDVVRAPAWSPASTRWAGLGDLGLRAFTGLNADMPRAAETASVRRVVHHGLSGLSGAHRSTAESGIRRAVRPRLSGSWVGAWGRSVGGGPGGAIDWKSRASRRLGVWLEPQAVGAADALVAVSQGTIDGIVERMPSAGRCRTV
jgi:hypothetical protein